MSYYRLYKDMEMPLSDKYARNLMSEMTRENPAYVEAKRMKLVHNPHSPEIEEYAVVGDMVYLPRYLYTTLPAKIRAKFEDATTTGEWVETLGNVITLRDYQDTPTKRIVQQLLMTSGCVLKALMGSGKTTVALEVARRMKLKTVIVVHTEFLLNQWRERIQQFLDVESGVIQGDRCEVDKPIVVAMMQSLVARDYEDIDVFGLVIADETHKASAPTMSAAIRKFSAKYRLGVSGTVERRDGLQWIYYSHISPPVVEMTRSDEYVVNPIVYQMEAPRLGVSDDTFSNYRGQLNLTKAITALSEDPRRNNWLTKHISDAATKGRRVIVFSDRREHLKVLSELFESKFSKGKVPEYGFLVGGMKEKDRAISQKKQVLFCTTALAAEGLDIPELDAVIFATPKSDVQQAVGRVERALEGKRQPIVLDIVDPELGFCVGMANKRATYYRSRGWQVKR